MRALVMDAPRMPDGPPIRDGKPYSRIAHLAEEVRPFVAIARHLRGRGLSAPEILAADLAAVQPTPNVGCDTVGRFVRGIIAQEDRMISWIAIDDVMPNDEMAEAA